MANSWNSPDQMAETLIKNLLGVADFVIDSKKLTDSDEIDLRLAVEALNKYRAPPLTATKSTLPPRGNVAVPVSFRALERAAHLRVYKLMKAAYTVGKCTSVTPSAHRFVAQQAALRMRESRQPKVNERKEALHTVLRGIRERVQLKNSDKFAESIKDQVWKELESRGRKEKRLSNRTIRRAIRSILEECR